MIGTLGHSEHGKTTLTAAIAKVLRAKYSTAQTLASGDTDLKGSFFSSTITQVQYRIGKSLYTHLDASEDRDYLKQLVTGALSLDVGILVVSANEGPMTQTREHVLLARQLGIRKIVVALTKADAIFDEELFDLVEMEIRELLSSQGYAGDSAPVVPVSGRGALEGDPHWIKSIDVLMRAVDDIASDRSSIEERPFLLAIEDVNPNAYGSGTVVNGKVERGLLAVDSEIEIVGLRPASRAIVSGIQIDGEGYSEAREGDECSLLIDGLQPEDLERGQVLAEPGSIGAHSVFSATVYFPTTAESGWSGPLHSGATCDFYLRKASISGDITFSWGMTEVRPGMVMEASVVLSRPVALEDGLGFALLQNGLMVGAGRVTAISDDSYFSPGLVASGWLPETNDFPLVETDEIERAVLLEIATDGAGVYPEAGADGLAVEVDGELLWPTFQFATTQPLALYEVVRSVAPLLDAREDPLGAISWWKTKNVWLGYRPADLLGKGRDEEIFYAAQQLHNDSW